MSEVRIFGIRHHGPGCAKSLLKALSEMQPDRILVEGPPEGDGLLSFVNDPEMCPPVALLVYEGDDESSGVFYPFAEFSPEWNVLKFGAERGVEVSFMDLPVGWRPKKDSWKGSSARFENSPLDAFAVSAGYEDGESWWNHMVEEGNDGAGLFVAILDAMKVLRETFPKEEGTFGALEEELREAHMRKTIRQAVKEGCERIAVVCGAWHAPALIDLSNRKKDDDLLKTVEKKKMSATWIPWSYRHISSASGYGAGVDSPGWYEHVWRVPPEMRTASWFGKIAARFREEDMDCSSAHIIEAMRLADALAAMRDRCQAGLDEINEAVRSVICMGDATPLRLVERDLMVGGKMGSIPSSAPSVPLQEDLERTVRSLRMKQETQDRIVDLDLRQPNDLMKSHLLHRLSILGVDWGVRRGNSSSTKGSFHEVWVLKWKPEMVLSVITSAKYGNTVKNAAAKMAVVKASEMTSISEMSSLLEKVMFADLPEAVDEIVSSLDGLASTSGDVGQVMHGVPPLVRVIRYGNVRNTDSSSVRSVVGHMMSRICVGLGTACCSLDEASAGEMSVSIVATNTAVGILDDEDVSLQWSSAVDGLTSDSYHGMLSGLASRLSFDSKRSNSDETMGRMRRALSQGNAPDASAAWLEGFLNGSAIVLLHDATLWGLLDSWLSGLGNEHFDRVLPLLRRAFSSFTPNDRSELARMTKKATSGLPANDPDSKRVDVVRANKVLPVIRLIAGCGL